MPLAHTFLLLGRVSNLPSIWSNCLAAFVLGGAGEWHFITPVLIGASFFYLGGMFLNDAFDANFDRHFRKERPIPKGMINEKTVWIIGGIQLFIGLICFSLARVPISLSLTLSSAILTYNALHKTISYSPILMALCRFLLFLCVASIGEKGITGSSVWGAIVLASYILGLSFLAKGESRKEVRDSKIARLPCLLIAAPALLAFLVNDGQYRFSGLTLIIIYGTWMLCCLRHLWMKEVQIQKAVSGLLAGIVLVDLLSLGLDDLRLTFLFAILFLVALLCQKFIPAT